MNPAYAKVLAFVFFFGIGTFNIARGVASIRARTESTFLGWLRLILGVLMLMAPIPLLLFLRSGQTQ